MNQLLKLNDLEKFIGSNVFMGMIIRIDGFPWKVVEYIGDYVLLTESVDNILN